MARTRWAAEVYAEEAYACTHGEPQMKVSGAWVCPIQGFTVPSPYFSSPRRCTRMCAGAHCVLPVSSTFGASDQAGSGCLLERDVACPMHTSLCEGTSASALHPVSHARLHYMGPAPGTSCTGKCHSATVPLVLPMSRRVPGPPSPWNRSCDTEVLQRPSRGCVFWALFCAIPSLRVGSGPETGPSSSRHN